MIPVNMLCVCLFLGNSVKVVLSQGQDGGHPFDPNKLMQQFMQMRTDQNVFGSYNPIDVKEAAKAYFQKNPPLGGMQTGNINAELNGFDPNGQSMFAGHQSEIWKFSSTYNPNQNIHKYVSESTDVGSLGSIHSPKGGLNQGVSVESHPNSNFGANTLISNVVPTTSKHNFGPGVGTPSTFSLPTGSMHMPMSVDQVSGITDIERQPGFNPNHLNHELFQNLGYNPEAVISETVLPHHNPMALIGQGTAHPSQNLEIGNSGTTHSTGKTQDGGTAGKQTDGATMSGIKDGGNDLSGTQSGGSKTQNSGTLHIESINSGTSTQNSGFSITGTGSMIPNGGSINQNIGSKAPNGGTVAQNGGVQAGGTAHSNGGSETQNGGSTGTQTQNGGIVNQNGGTGTHFGGTPTQNVGTKTQNGETANQNGGNSGPQNSGTVIQNGNSGTQNEGKDTGSNTQTSNQPKYHIVLNNNGEHVLVQSTDEPGKFIVIKTISNEKLANYLIAKLSSSRNGSPVPDTLSAFMSVQKTPKPPSNFNDGSAQPTIEGSPLNENPNGYHAVPKEQMGAYGTQAIQATGIGGLGGEHVGHIQNVFGIGSLGEGSQSRGPDVQTEPVDSASTFNMDQVNTNPYIHATGIGTLGSQLPGLESASNAHATDIGSLGNGGENSQFTRRMKTSSSRKTNR